MIKAMRFLAQHPIASVNFGRSVERYLRWQLGSRLLNVPHLLPYTDHATLVTERGDYSASNQYLCGLSEYPEQAFACHYLRRHDQFWDIGANIGAFSVLVAAFVGCRTLALEPAASEFAKLSRNLKLNALEDLVDARQLAAADASRRLLMTADWGNGNQVWENLASDGTPIVPTELRDVATVSVDGVALDELADLPTPTLIKIDVEGFEFRVLEGAKRLLANPALEAIIIEDTGQGHGGDAAPLLSVTLASAGFQSVHYDPKQRLLRALTANEKRGNNLILVRNLDLARERVENAPSIHVLGCVI